MDALGRVLLAERPAGKHLAGYWEFPGGKVEPGELPLEGLARELQEELGIELVSAEPLIRIPWRYDNRQLLLDAWRIDRWKGELQSLEGQALQWCVPAEVDPQLMTPADRPILQALRLPAVYVVTPARAKPDDLPKWYERIDRAIRESGTRLLQLNLPLWATKSVRALAKQLLPVANEHGCQILLSGDLEGALEIGAGVHLTIEQLNQAPARPLSWQQLIGVSCADASQLQAASWRGADFAMILPMAAADHVSPDWDAFHVLVEAASLPIYAQVGSYDLASVALAKRHGAQGIAPSGAVWTK